jgi:hypothetical protein
LDHTSGTAGISSVAATRNPAGPAQNLDTPLLYERTVLIKSISQKEMDRFLPHRFNIDRFIGAEAEWFSDEVGNIIGTIAEGATNMHWGYAVLRRDDCGKYQFWDLETGIESGDAARTRIVHAMEAIWENSQACPSVMG